MHLISVISQSIVFVWQELHETLVRYKEEAAKAEQLKERCEMLETSKQLLESQVQNCYPFEFFSLWSHLFNVAYTVLQCSH